MSSLKKIFKAIRCYGFGFLAYRALYVFKMKSGLLKLRFRPKSWRDLKLSQFTDSKLQTFRESDYPKFFFRNDEFVGLNKGFEQGLLADAREVLNNRFCYFFDKYHTLNKTADWCTPPITGFKISNQTHWCDIPHFDNRVGDIKYLWEPSRFAWAYTLMRAYSATGDNRYADKFWSVFDTWLEANQPNLGVNFACGQECAIRLMAIIFVFFALRNHHSCTDERLEKLLIAIAIHAQRIIGNIGYAISTKTNHSLTEAAGIYTAGLLFPKFYEAEKWCNKGKEVFTKEAVNQIFDDGSYIQHSMNYHRLMLQDIIWFLRLGWLNGDTFDNRLIIKAKAAVEFLYQMHNPISGRVPNYGANDGALIIPLNNCDYLDYRPVLQCGYYLFNHKRIFENGLWNEDLVWLFGKKAMESEIEQKQVQSSQFNTGGYYTLKSENSWCMTRCHTFKTRPGHADMVHLDLWYKSINILRDSGSYMYNCQEPWQSYFPSTFAHNTVAIDGKNQMNRLSRFMWSGWTKSKLISFVPKGPEKFIEAEHYGYWPLIHRRKICLSDGKCVIIDEIKGDKEHDIELNWHLLPGCWSLDGGKAVLKDAECQMCILVEPQHDLVELKIIEMPESLFYGSKKNTQCLNCRTKIKLPAVFTTTVMWS